MSTVILGGEAPRTPSRIPTTTQRVPASKHTCLSASKPDALICLYTLIHLFTAAPALGFSCSLQDLM